MIGVVLFLLAGLAEAGMDVLMFRHQRSIFKGKFFSPDSWKNKWSDLIPGAESPWYYFGVHTPQFREAFPYSSTMLVGLTDGWHMFKLFRNMFLMLGVVFLVLDGVWWIVFAVYLANRVGFYLGYNLLYLRVTWISNL